MKRFTAVRVLTQALLPADIAVFIGEEICREAAPYRDHPANIFFADDEDYLLSLVLGMAMCTNKRIFIFCEDQYFIRNLSEIMQIGVSKCKNIFLVLFINGHYTSVDGAPIIFDGINSQHGVMYNLGFLVHDYTKHFKNSRNPIKEIREVWVRTRGPLAVLLKTEKGTKQTKEVAFTTFSDLERITEFILNDEIKPHNYVPPFSLEELESK